MSQCFSSFNSLEGFIGQGIPYCDVKAGTKAGPRFANEKRHPQGLREVGHDMKCSAILAMEENRHHVSVRVADKFGGKGRPGRINGSPSTESPRG